MATSTQLAALADRAKPNPERKPDPIKPALVSDNRQPTSASLPILSPPHVPPAPVFAAPPASLPAALSPAQKAVFTRQQRAAGILPAKGEPAAKPSLSPARPDGLHLVLSIAPTAKGMAVTFAHQVGGEAASPAAVPEAERGLGFLSAICERGEGGDLVPATGVTFTGTASADQLAAVLPVMRRVTASLCQAYQDSEDASFPQMVLTLAGILRVDRVEFTPPGGEKVSVKRGAAYITAFKAGEAHKAG